VYAGTHVPGKSVSTASVVIRHRPKEIFPAGSTNRVRVTTRLFRTTQPACTAPLNGLRPLRIFAV
jgi:hypothetical protein